METKIKTPMVFAINYPNLVIKVLNTETRQYEVYKELHARDYKTLSSVIQALYDFIGDHIEDYHFNGLHNLHEFVQNVKSLNGYYGN